MTEQGASAQCCQYHIVHMQCQQTVQDELDL
jgi:hypothetical protein